MTCREPTPPPFPVGTRLICVDGTDAYVPCVPRPRARWGHPDDWVRVSGRGLEVKIARVWEGRRGTGEQLRDDDGPMFDDDGAPRLDDTDDGYSVYQIDRGGGRLAGRCIWANNANKWQILKVTDNPVIVDRGDFIKEGMEYGLVLTSGAKTFDTIWIGGSTTRYRHGVRAIEIIAISDMDERTRRLLTDEANAARAERRSGARIKRGTVSPRR